MCEMCQEEKDATYVLLFQRPWKAPESTGMDIALSWSSFFPSDTPWNLTAGGKWDSEKGRMYFRLAACSH